MSKFSDDPVDVGIFDDNPGYTFEPEQVTNKTLVTSKSICSVCKIGMLKPEGKPTYMIVYGRNGAKVYPHQYTRCRFRAGTDHQKVVCRASYSLGFKNYRGVRIYDDDALKNEILIVSSQTAFHINLLVEIVGQVNVSSATFEGIAKQYNRFHQMKLPYDVQDRRAELTKDIVNNAYFLFCYLEIGQRYGIPNYQVIKNDLDNAILDNKSEFMKAFRRTWTLDHHCDITGCGSCIVIDAGLKPHRKVCKALWNGIREFEYSGLSVITGCTSYPIPNKTYCTVHDEEETPVADKISSNTRKTLRDFRNDSSEVDKRSGDDNAFTVESILNIRENEDGKKMYLIKWFNFPPEAATWEPQENVPRFIADYIWYFLSLPLLGWRMWW